MTHIDCFVEDTFDAAHFLPNVADGHKCKRMHGHTYKIRITVRGAIDPVYGWVIDYSEIKAIWNRLKIELDHHCLNDLIPNPTCELLAVYIAGRLDERMKIHSIELRETANCGVFLDCNAK